MAFVFEGGSFELGSVIAIENVPEVYNPPFGVIIGNNFDELNVVSTGTIMSSLWTLPQDVEGVSVWTGKDGAIPTISPFRVSTNAPFGMPKSSNLLYLNSLDNNASIAFRCTTGAVGQQTYFPEILACSKSYEPFYGNGIGTPIGGSGEKISEHTIISWSLVNVTKKIVSTSSTKQAETTAIGVLLYTKESGYVLWGGTRWDAHMRGLESNPIFGEWFNEHFFTPKQPPVPVNPDLPGSGGTQGEGGSGTGQIPDDRTIGVNQSYANSGVLASGMVTAWKLDRQGLTDLANALWQKSILDQLKQMFTDPFDVIVSCRMFPGTGISTVAGTVKFGNIDSGVSAAYYTADAGNPLLSSYSGKFTISEVWGSFLDYAPLTRINIYLPYIGIEELDPAQIVGKTLNVDYYVNIVSGECIASLTTETQFVGTYKGQMGIDIPLTGRNTTNQILAAVSSIGQVINGAAGLAGAVATGDPIKAASAATQTTQSVVSGAVTLLNNLSPGYRRMNGAGGYSNWMMPQMPFLIITRPNISNPEDFQELNGYTSNISGLLEEFDGFTVCQTVHLDGITATDREKDMIRELLQQGVIL